MVGKKLPLNDWHAQAGARFMEENGWLVPESYGKADMEYAALRNGTGLADLCHEARYRIEGPDALPFLNAITTVDVSKIPEKTAAPAFCCNRRGGILDLVTIYRDEKYFLLFGSGRARHRMTDWLKEKSMAFKGGVATDDLTTTQAHFAVRGPGAATMLDRISFTQKITLEPGQATVITIGSARTLVVRRPKAAGIDGYDVVTGAIYLQPLWEKFAEASRATGARPIGLTAREIYRVETGIPAHSAEYDENTTPVELGRGDEIDFTKGEFEGRRALLHSTSSDMSRVLVALRLEANAAVERGAEILFESLPVGVVTSTVVSPALRVRLALGFVNVMKAAPGTSVKVCDKAGAGIPAEILKPGDALRR
jgi:aminomethyltransferase